MAGTSEREKAIKTVNAQAQRPFRFDYPQMMGEINKATNKGSQYYRQQAAQQGAELGRQTAASLQSRGVGGSVLASAVQRAKNNANINAGNNIQQLMLRKLLMTPQIMQNLNAMDLQKLRLQGDLAGKLSDDTWFDDMLALANTVGNIAGSI